MQGTVPPLLHVLIMWYLIKHSDDAMKLFYLKGDSGRKVGRNDDMMNK
jgi:hypothetical protein